jgi:hypothetical protein
MGRRGTPRPWFLIPVNIPGTGGQYRNLASPPQGAGLPLEKIGGTEILSCANGFYRANVDASRAIAAFVTIDYEPFVTL